MSPKVPSDPRKDSRWIDLKEIHDLNFKVLKTARSMLIQARLLENAAETAYRITLHRLERLEVELEIQDHSQEDL